MIIKLYLRKTFNDQTNTIVDMIIKIYLRKTFNYQTSLILDMIIKLYLRKTFHKNEFIYKKHKTKWNIKHGCDS